MQNLNIEYWPEGYCLRSYPLALRHLMDGAADIDSPAEISSSMLFIEEFFKFTIFFFQPINELCHDIKLDEMLLQAALEFDSKCKSFHMYSIYYVMLIV